MNRFIPSWSNLELKLIRSPTRLPVTFRYVSTCASNTGSNLSTLLISRITQCSTTQIDTIFPNCLIFIDHRKDNLPVKVQSGTFQLDCQSRFVGAFKEARSRLPVHFDSTTDDSFRQFIYFFHFSMKTALCEGQEIRTLRPVNLNGFLCGSVPPWLIKAGPGCAWRGCESR
jgi:hypothetical protein